MPSTPSGKHNGCIANRIGGERAAASHWSDRHQEGRLPIGPANLWAASSQSQACNLDGLGRTNFDGEDRIAAQPRGDGIGFETLADTGAGQIGQSSIRASLVCDPIEGGHFLLRNGIGKVTVDRQGGFQRDGTFFLRPQITTTELERALVDSWSTRRQGHNPKDRNQADRPESSPLLTNRHRIRKADID